MENPPQDLSNALSRDSESRFSIFGTTFQGAQIIQFPGSEDVKRHMFRSVAIAVAAPLLLFSPLAWTGLATQYLTILLALSAYVTWASYWGIVGMASYVADFDAREVGRNANLGIYLLGSWIGTSSSPPLLSSGFFTGRWVEEYTSSRSSGSSRRRRL